MLGVILAGGHSSRMGTDKAFVEIHGRTMLASVAEALSAVVDDIVVVGRAELEGYRAIPDETPHQGPLTGVVTALRLGEDILCVAVDQPFLLQTTLRALAEAGRDQDQPRPVVPHVDGFTQVTCAFYPVAFLDTAARALEEGKPLWRALTESGYETFVAPPEEDGRSWLSIDTPEDLADATVRFQPPM